MATPQFLRPTQLVETRPFEADYSGQDFIVEEGLKQAKLEEEARRKHLALLEQQRAILENNLRALNNKIAGETGQTARLEFKTAQDAETQYRDAKLRAETTNVTQERLDDRGEYNAQEAMKRTLVREAGSDRRFGVSSSSRVPRGSPQDRYIQEAVATGKVNEGIELLFNRMAQDRTISENRAEAARTAAEYAGRAAIEYARRNGIGIDEALEKVIRSIENPAYRELVLSGLPSTSTLDLTTADDENTEPIEIPPTQVPPPATVSTYHVKPKSAEKRGAAGLVENKHITELEKRRDELAKRLTALNAKAQSLSQPIDYLARGQEIAHRSAGALSPEAKKVKLDAEATQLAGQYLQTYSDREQDELTRRSWNKITRDPIYRSVDKIVKMSGATTDWERVRQTILGQYNSNDRKLKRALAYYKFSRYKKDENPL